MGEENPPVENANFSKGVETKGDTGTDLAVASADDSNTKTLSLSQKWTDFIINYTRKPIVKVLLKITDFSAANPKITITSVVLFSILLLVIGLFTNFNVDVDEDVLWTPRDSRPLKHGRWIEDESGFKKEPRYYMILVHSNGDNVLTQEGGERVFTAIDNIRNTPGYDSLCAEDTRKDLDTCDVLSITKFWNHSHAIFQDNVASDKDAIDAMSAMDYPDLTPVDERQVFGFPKRDENGDLTGAISFVSTISLPDVDDAEAFEEKSINRMLDLKDAWLVESDNKFRLEIFTQRSFSDEFTRAIVNDIPLVPAVFVVMSIFTCIVFVRRDWVYSRSLLGFGAVVSVLLSIMTGYGLLFTIGTPFTSMTQVSDNMMFRYWIVVWCI